MPGSGTRVDGKYGAHARGGGELLARELDRMATEGGVKSLHAKLAYLTNSVAGQEAMVDAGINLANSSTRNTVLGWLGDEELHAGVGINHANAARIEAAYAERRRETMAGRIKARLARGGGAYVEVSPPDQTHVAPRHRRAVEDLGQDVVHIRILDDVWAALVDRWETGDTTAMQDTWEGTCDEHLYPPEAFYHCGDIRIAA